MKTPIWLDPMWQGCPRLVMTPAVCFPFQEQVLAWCRVHGLDPSRTGDIVLAPSLHSLAASTYDLNEYGHPFSHDGQEPAFHWLFRRLTLPPPAEWCLDYVTRTPILDGEELTT